jgi:small subunit ribosomal protein S21
MPSRSAFLPNVVRPSGGDKPSHRQGIMLHTASPGFIGLNWRESESATVQVIVRDNNVDQALKALKKKMQREGIFREMKLRRAYEKPSERRAREKAEAVRRARKLERKRLEREGF